MSAPFPCHPIPAVAAAMEADAALAARARRLGIGLADVMPTPLHDPAPIRPARLVEVCPGATCGPATAAMFATPVESINADLLSSLEDILALPGTALGRCSLREAEAVARANAAIARARGVS